MDNQLIMITADANFRIVPDGRVYFDYVNTSVEARPIIVYDGTNFNINLSAVIISTIEQADPMNPVEPLTEVVGTRAYNLGGTDLVIHDAGILTALGDLVVALEKYIGADIEANNPGVTVAIT